MTYEGKHVLVLGLGESGLAMARWLARCGAVMRVADTRVVPPCLSALLEYVPQAEFIGGEFTPGLLDAIDFVAVSPGLAPEGELLVLTPVAQEKNIPLWGEIELFAQGLAALRNEREYIPKVIAITGTNGKTTVTSLVGLLCQRAGLTTQIAGNISPAALDVLRDVLERNALPQVWVLELSSFQLHTTFTLQADAATVLNVTQDHLDWHGDMLAYAADKEKIFAANTVRVLNRADSIVMKMAPPPFASALLPVTFGIDPPDEADCFGLLNERGMQWLTLAVAAEEGEKRRRKQVETPLPVLINRLMPADALKIRGQHNALNALAALALCRAIGLPMASLLHGLREYQGESHRAELVTTIAGVQYVDDSKGTNVGATVAALNGMSAGAESGAVPSSARLILIAGGDGKGQDFSPLAEPVSRYAKAVFLIGKDADSIRAALEQTGVNLIGCTTLEEAVQRATLLAQSGDIVLLSPACASLDMFTNYVHRAKVFVDAVREIAFAHGEVAL